MILRTGVLAYDVKRAFRRAPVVWARQTAAPFFVGECVEAEIRRKRRQEVHPSITPNFIAPLRHAESPVGYGSRTDIPFRSILCADEAHCFAVLNEVHLITERRLARR